MSSPSPSHDGGCDSSDPLRGAISGEVGRDALLLLHALGQMLLLFLGLAHAACTFLLALLRYKFRLLLGHAHHTVLFHPAEIFVTAALVAFFKNVYFM